MIREYGNNLTDILVKYGKVTAEQVACAVQEVNADYKIEDIIINQKLVSEEEILTILENYLETSRVNLETIEFDKNVVLSLTGDLAVKYKCIPICIQNNKIKIAMFNPLDLLAIDDIKLFSGYEVEPVLASKRDIERAISKYYSYDYIRKSAMELSMEKQSLSKENYDEGLSDVSSSPIVKIVDLLIENAVFLRASDIHIEPFSDYIKIRYRIDGELKEMLRFPINILNALTGRVKVMANLDISEKRRPQDGRILTRVNGEEIDIRISIVPTVYGEKLAARILNKNNFNMSKEQIGLSQYDINKLDDMLKNSNGMILVAGPTGSGKSTTLYKIIEDLNRVNKNIITIEDPVEYLIDGINQINVNFKIDLTFSRGLKSILRQDPDIIMIGEIRDSETAQISVRAAITGHLVLSSIHTKDAPSTIARLTDVGIEPYLIAASVIGIISQRLVRKICPHCKTEYTPNEYEYNALDIKNGMDVKLYRGTGCRLCDFKGYIGRTGIFELMEITNKHREMIIKGRSVDDIRKFSIECGMKTLKMSCRELVLNGITTLDEFIRISYLNE